MIKYDIPAETRLRVVTGAMMGTVAKLLNAYVAQRGERGWTELEEMFEDIGRDRAPNLKKRLEVDPDDISGLMRVVEFEDTMFGIEGEWTEVTPARAVKIEHKCALADQLKGCPEYCTRLMIAMEKGTFEGLGGSKRKTLAIPRVIAKGDEKCEVVIEIHG